jgi:hypothetical protein
MNNPLKYTDPSGYFFKFLKKVAKAWRSAWRSVKNLSINRNLSQGSLNTKKRYI